MAEVHVARVGLFTTDQNGQRLDKCCPSTTINQMKNTKMEFLIIPDSTNSNTSGYPTIAEYLKLEVVQGFILNHLDQSFVITYKTP
jgi:hypothetical protein